MTRIRLLVAMCAAIAVLSVAPALAQEEAPMGDNGPAVVLDQEAAPIEEEAWTFRFLIPTLILGTGAAVFAVVAGYGLRVRARYRVTQ
jgi:hypothetical protein